MKTLRIIAACFLIGVITRLAGFPIWDDGVYSEKNLIIVVLCCCVVFLIAGNDRDT